MKNMVFKTLTCILLQSQFFFSLFAQNNASHNSLFPNSFRITYSVLMKDTLAKYPDSSYMMDFTKHTEPYYRKQETGTTQIGIIDLLMEKMLSGTIAVSSYWSDMDINYPYGVLEYKKFYSLDDIKARCGGLIVYRSYDQETESYKIDSTVEKKINRKEIQSLHFIEDWNFNAENFTFQKKVLAFSPRRHYYKPEDSKREDPLIKLIGYIINPSDNGKLQNMQLIETIKYEFHLYNDFSCKNTSSCYWEKVLEENPIITDYSRNILINTIVNNVLDTSIQAYDFDTNQALTIEEVRERIDCKETVVNYPDSTGKMKTYHFSDRFNPRRVQAIIFVEDWYIDLESMQMEKKVKGIAPVLYSWELKLVDNKPVSFVKRSVPFVVYFSK